MVVMSDQTTSEVAIALYEGNSYYLLSFAILHPIVCFKQSPALRGELLKVLPKKISNLFQKEQNPTLWALKLHKTSNVIAPELSMGAVHFEALEKVWNTSHYPGAKQILLKPIKHTQQLREIQLEF